MSGRALNVLAALPDGEWQEWRPALERAFVAAGLKVRLDRDLAPEAVDYIIYTPTGALDDFAPYTNARAVLSLWAGVERIIGNASLTQNLTRMVDPGLREGMREWVAGHALRAHLGMDRDICRADAVWAPHTPPLARDRQVAVLGLGALGLAAAEMLVALGFQVSGWSRRLKDIKGVACFAGAAGLREVLARAEILVLLLPLTPETEDILNAETLAHLPRGAVVLNPGRGALIDDAALLAALDSGQVGQATLDVFRDEPLAPDHPYWAHPHVTVTPHIASATRPQTASELVAENIRRAEAGEPLLFLVDRSAGY